MTKASEILTAQQRSSIRRADDSDAALARKYGVTAKTIRDLREPAEKPKGKPKKRAAAKKTAKADALPDEGWIKVLGGPELPRPIS